MMLVSKKITVSGKVQGVWFRKHTSVIASELGVKGTVQNVPTGEVVIHATGTSVSVKRLEEWYWQGSPQSIVQRVVCEDMELKPYVDFRIID